MFRNIKIFSLQGERNATPWWRCSGSCESRWSSQRWSGEGGSGRQRRSPFNACERSRGASCEASSQRTPSEDGTSTSSQPCYSR